MRDTVTIRDAETFPGRAEITSSVRRYETLVRDLARRTATPSRRPAWEARCSRRSPRPSRSWIGRPPLQMSRRGAAKEGSASKAAARAARHGGKMWGPTCIGSIQLFGGTSRLCAGGAPFLGRYISHMLREEPSVAVQILDLTMPFAKSGVGCIARTRA
jgi:hypothetical protein